MGFSFRKGLLTAAAALLTLALAGCGSAGQKVSFPHVHGLGYSADGSRLMVPAHDGFRIYAGGKWQVPDVPKHDYMGYSPTAKGFYSSGHPAPGSKLPNPLGLVWSEDDGKTLTMVDFVGETDFHVMAVGYKVPALYLLNPAPGSKLQAGLHYSLDQGKTWKKSAMQGVDGQVVQLAVHPEQPGTVAAAAAMGGLFLSSDHGQTFRRMSDVKPVSAVTFSPDGSTLWFGYDKLYRLPLAGGTAQAVAAPAVSPKDAIGYIAVNPAKPSEAAIATFGADLHITADGGNTWKTLAAKGQSK